jgi:hypothetical protein
MSTKGVVRYDNYLTNLALAYPTGNLIAEQLCPVVGVENYSDKIFVDADDAINQMNDDAEGVPSNEVDFGIGTPYSYRTRRRALNSTITDKEAQNSKSPVRLQQRETNKLTHRLKIKHEIRVSAILRNTSLVTQYENVESITNAQWDDANPQVEESIKDAVGTIYDGCGAVANTIVIPFKAGLELAKMDWIKELLKAQYGMQYLQGQIPGQTMQLVGLPPFIKGLRVIIANGRVNNANKGETASVGNLWGKDVLIGYVPQAPGIDELFGCLTMEYDSMKVFTERRSDPNGLKVLVEWDYDILQAELKCWYLMQNVID